MKDFKILLKYHALLKPFFAVFMIAIVFDLGMTGMGLLNPLFTRILFDFAYPYHNLALLNVAVLAIVVSYFLLFFLSVASDYLQIYVNMEMTSKLTSKVYHAIQCLPLKFHQEKKSGDLLVRITDDVDAAIGMVTSVIPTVLIEGGRFIIILVIALMMNPLLTVLALFSIPLYILETKFYVNRLQRVQQESIDIGSRIFTHAQERLSSIKTIKAFGQENSETLTFGRLLRQSYRVGIKGKILSVISTFTNSITLQMWSLFLTWYLGYQVVKGTLTIGEIVALMLYLEQLGGPIQSFIGLITNWKVSMVSINRLEEILEAPSEASVEDEHRPELAVSEGRVSAEDLSFSYAADTEVLHQVDVSFPDRSLTAIVGGSGSGKSTLVNLLLRFFDASKGAIFIDGQNISEIRVRSLRQHVGMIAQDFSLFDGTVMENILYGNEGKTRDDAVEAAKLASAYDFITHFPRGFDEPVGSGGELLSGGQRQRIAIARTLLKNPRILIFDEATSALDPESEYRIQEIMQRLAKSKTVIAIAHRLSTIKTADKILVLEDGRFVEEGKFDELIEKRGAFYRFYWRQFGGLSNLRQHLGMEFERAARYGSTFSVALLRVAAYREVLENLGEEQAHELMNAVEYALEKNIRMGDNCSILDEDYILILLPEANEEQIKGFFARMSKLVDEALALSPTPVAEHQLLFIASHIMGKPFRTPEELMSALKFKADSLLEASGTVIVSPSELLTTYQIGSELMRAARQQLNFSIALVKIDAAQRIADKDGAEAASVFMQDVLALFIKNIRAHDNVTLLGKDYVALFTPEYDEKEIFGSMNRMVQLMTKAPRKEIRKPIIKSDVHIAAICATKTMSIAPEVFLEAFRAWMEAQPPIEGVRMVTLDELENYYGIA